MHGPRLESVGTEGAGEHVASLLCLDEDEDAVLGGQVLAEVGEEFAVLVHVIADLKDLGDILVSGELEGAYGDLVVLLEVVAGEALDGLGPGGGPHEDLAVGADLGADLAELGLRRAKGGQ